MLQLGWKREKQPSPTSHAREVTTTPGPRGESVVPHICHHCHYKGGCRMLVASANACQGQRSNPLTGSVPLALSSSALPVLVGDPAVPCWGGPGHSAGVTGSCRGSAQGGCCRKRVVNGGGAIPNLPLTQRCTNKSCLSSLPSGCPSQASKSPGHELFWSCQGPSGCVWTEIAVQGYWEHQVGSWA